MFKKVLIAEDFESFNISVQKVLNDLKIEDPHYAYYCDDAFLKVKRALQDKEPFDLLISDLSFEEDHREQNLKSGHDLIKAVKEIQPDIKVIVFSVEKKPDMVDSLFDKLRINGFVAKGREDSTELKKAIKAVYKEEKYINLNLKQSIQHKNTFEFTSVDITIVSLLSNGMMIRNIPDYLKKSRY